MTGQYVDMLALETQITAEWQNDPALRREFESDFEIFKAFRTAEARGQVKQRTGQVEGGGQ